MKILLLTDGIFPYVIGGMQKHSYYLAKYLSRNQVKVDLCHCIYQDEIPDSQSVSEDVFSREELGNITFSAFKFPKKDPLPGHYIRENKAYSNQLYESVKGKIDQYDLIYAQGFTGWRFIEERKKGNVSAPVLVNFHGMEMFQKAPSFRAKFQHFLFRPSTKWHLVNADYVSSFGGQFVKILEELNIPTSRIVEIPIGIEASWLNEEVDSATIGQVRKFVFIGRYERRKGLIELNIVLNQLLEEKIENFEFHFIGPIPEEKRVIDEKIIYHGQIRDQAKIQSILNQCEILVCPSYSEGMPTVILEAMAKGLAIIATRVGAVEKEVQGNGWLMDSVDVELLKKTIKEAIQTSPDQLATYQKQSISLIKAYFLWDRVIDLMIEEFEKMIKGNLT